MTFAGGTNPSVLIKNKLCVQVYELEFEECTAGWEGGVSSHSFGLSLELVKHATGYMGHISQVNRQSNMQAHTQDGSREMLGARERARENFSPCVKINKHVSPPLSFSLSQ